MPLFLTPEKIAEMNREFEALWLGPSFRALIEDARYFQGQMQNAGDEQQARCARVVVVFSVAAVEAATNDALAAIDDFMSDGYWGSETRHEKPWVHFWNRSARRVRQLQRRGRLGSKMDYLLRLLEGETGWTLDDDVLSSIGTIVQIRNRIVHMASLSSPNKMLSILNVKQIRHTAEIAIDTATEYTEFLDEGFEEMNLPIRVVDPALSEGMPD